MNFKYDQHAIAIIYKLLLKCDTEDEQVEQYNIRIVDIGHSIGKGYLGEMNAKNIKFTLCNNLREKNIKLCIDNTCETIKNV